MMSFASAVRVHLGASGSKLGLLVLIVAGGMTMPAWAAMNGQTAATHAVSSATLAPPSGLAVTTSCGPALSLTAEASLSWTATPSAFATGYVVERWLGAILQSTTTVTPLTSTTLTDAGLATGTTYTWKVRASVRSWTSTEISESAATPGLCL